MRLRQEPYLIKTGRKKERREVRNKDVRVKRLSLVASSLWLSGEGAVIVETAARADYAQALSANCLLGEVDFDLSPFRKAAAAATK